MIRKDSELAPEIVDLFASEYGWSRAEIASLTPDEARDLMRAIHQRRMRAMLQRMNELLYPHLDPGAREAMWRQIESLNLGR